MGIIDVWKFYSRSILGECLYYSFSIHIFVVSKLLSGQCNLSQVLWIASKCAASGGIKYWKVFVFLILYFSFIDRQCTKHKCKTSEWCYARLSILRCIWRYYKTSTFMGYIFEITATPHVSYLEPWNIILNPLDCKRTNLKVSVDMFFFDWTVFQL